MKRKRRIRKILVILLVILLILAGACGWYLCSGNYAAADDAQAMLTAEDPDVTITEEENKYIMFSPQSPTAGLIFYPGGKVDYEAYVPLMKACADRGILCILVHMPFDLAVFDQNAADGLTGLAPEIDTWLIGGHSLGGVMAASYVSRHTDEFKGIVFLASYTTNDLSGSGLKGLSVYGSEDGVLDMDSYEENKGNLPEDTLNFIIDGGCHAGFGDYGEQTGDHTPTISGEEQRERTAQIIAEWVKTIE